MRRVLFVRLRLCAALDSVWGQLGVPRLHSHRVRGMHRRRRELVLLVPCYRLRERDLLREQPRLLPELLIWTEREDEGLVSSRWLECARQPEAAWADAERDAGLVGAGFV